VAGQIGRLSHRRQPEISQFNLFYRPGAQSIRRSYQFLTLPDIRLQAGRYGAVANVDNQGLFSAEELGEHIIKWIAERAQVR
jgi:hypothetical protein